MAQDRLTSHAWRRRDEMEEAPRVGERFKFIRGLLGRARREFRVVEEEESRCSMAPEPSATSPRGKRTLSGMLA